MPLSALGPYGAPRGYPDISAKTPADYPPLGFLVYQFDMWREGYAGATINILRAGTTDLCPVYSDITLTEEADNPVVLMTREDDTGRRFGKFPQSLYVPYPYEVEINSIEQTGILYPPIVDMRGQDASYAEVTPTGASLNRALRDILSDEVKAASHGSFTASPATNTTIITAAISQASARGGGAVLLPAGTIVVNTLSIPANVFLKGVGSEITVLESQVGGEVITLADDHCGLIGLTLDGVSLISGSVGVFTEGKNNIYIEDVQVKRFKTGILVRGGSDHTWERFSVENCEENVRLLGELGDSNDGTAIDGISWNEGKCIESTGVGIEMSVVDLPVKNITISHVNFTDNVGSDSALFIYGANNISLDDCDFSGNTAHMDVSDNPDTSLDQYEVSGIRMYNCRFGAGDCKFDGLCDSIIFDQCNLTDTEIQANIPETAILIKDCVESGTTFTGDSTKVMRDISSQQGIVRGVTTDNTVTVVWKKALNPGQVVLLNVAATAEKVNGTDWAVFEAVHSAKCAAASLLYDEQTANFTAGKTLVGATSGAEAIIAADSDSGASGTLSLTQVSGVFVDNEIIAESNGSGSARANGVLSLGTAALGGAGQSDLHSDGSNTGAPPAGWALAFAVSGQEVRVTVTGANSTTVYWNVKVEEVTLV